MFIRLQILVQFGTATCHEYSKGRGFCELLEQLLGLMFPLLLVRTLVLCRCKPLELC